MLAVAGLLAACSSDNDSAPTAGTSAARRTTTAATSTATSRPSRRRPTRPRRRASGTNDDAPIRRRRDGGGTLNFGAIASPVSLNPGIGDPAFVAVFGWAYDPLIELLPDGTFGPSLAVEFGYVGDTNMRYELTLRDGVKFSDGTALDAAAVKTYLDYVRGATDVGRRRR